MRRCAVHAAIAYQEVSKDADFGHLGPCGLREVMQGLHQLIVVYPGLVTRASNLDFESGQFGYDAASFAVPGPPSVAVSQSHVVQTYMCKNTKLTPMRNLFPSVHNYEVCQCCAGHRGSWDWNLAKQMWQLTGKPHVVIKHLPGNVLELANLIGSLPSHVSDLHIPKEW